MIIHLYDDDSQGYQYEVGDWVRLNRDIHCDRFGMDHRPHDIQTPKGVYGKVSNNYWGSKTSWRIRQIRVELWNEEFRCFLGALVEPVWFFEPLQDICVVRNV